MCLRNRGGSIPYWYCFFCGFLEVMLGAETRWSCSVDTITLIVIFHHLLPYICYYLYSTRHFILLWMDLVDFLWFYQYNKDISQCSHYPLNYGANSKKWSLSSQTLPPPNTQFWRTRTHNQFVGFPNHFRSFSIILCVEGLSFGFRWGVQIETCHWYVPQLITYQCTSFGI